MPLIEEYVAEAYKDLAAEGFEPELEQDGNDFLLSVSTSGLEIRSSFHADRQPAISTSCLVFVPQEKYSVALAIMNSFNREGGHVRFFMNKNGEVLALAQCCATASVSAQGKYMALKAVASEVVSLTVEVAEASVRCRGKLEGAI